MRVLWGSKGRSAAVLGALPQKANSYHPNTATLKRETYGVGLEKGGKVYVLSGPGRKVARLFRALPLLSLSLAAAGCATFSEQYYTIVNRGEFKRQPPDVFRFDLRGWVFFSRSEFESGWFDKEAVDSLFSEVISEVSKRNIPEGGAPYSTLKTGGLGDQSPQKKERAFRVSGPEGERLDVSGKRFLIFLANNPKAITSQIETFSNALESSDALMSIIFRDQMGRINESKREADSILRRKDLLVVDVDNLIGTLKRFKDDPDKKGADVKEEVQRVIRIIKKLSNEK